MTTHRRYIQKGFTATSEGQSGGPLPVFPNAVGAKPTMEGFTATSEQQITRSRVVSANAVGAKPTKYGFTLLELLVVISIIGLLSAIVLTAMNTARAKSRDAERIKTVQELRKAIELYYSDNGYYPPLTTAPANAARTAGTVSCAVYGGATISGDVGWCDLMTAIYPYYKQPAKDPVNGAPAYYYYYDADGAQPLYYGLMTVLENSASENLATNDGGQHYSGGTGSKAVRGFEVGNEPPYCAQTRPLGNWRTGALNEICGS